MIVEQLVPPFRPNQPASVSEWILASKNWFIKRMLRQSNRPTVVFCYGLLQGESLEDWCRRNPESLPAPSGESVVWVLPERPLPRSVSVANPSFVVATP
jgi:hypothetical protein